MNEESVRPPLSRVLSDLARNAGPRVTIGDITEALAKRSFAALVLIFALPNLFPMPPGAAAVFGVPLMLLGAQMVVGYRRPYLPRLLADRGFEKGTFVTLVEKMTPRLCWLEQRVRRRWALLPERMLVPLTGAVVLILAFVLVLPIPFGNGPPAIALALVGLGLMERDGLLLCLGSAVGVCAVAVYGTLIVSLAHMAAGAL
nr:exopolysaccharide biosynthesis protein [Acuticoccus kandeliae]